MEVGEVGKSDNLSFMKILVFRISNFFYPEGLWHPRVSRCVVRAPRARPNAN